MCGSQGGAKQGWFFYEDELYFTFMPSMVTGWLKNAAANKARGDARWAEWFGSEALAGPLNVDCTAETWWGNTCCIQPQNNPGIPIGHPVSDGCISAIDSFCLDVRGGTTDAMMRQCEQCLTEHNDAIMAVGSCEAQPTSTKFPKAGQLAQLAHHVYCW